MTKYDDADWHVQSAIEAGQPEQNAFSHIGLYLGWLIRHDMVDAEFFNADDLAEVKAGTLTGSDLMSSLDGKLISDMLTDEGAAFSDWHYETYLSDFAETFVSDTDYDVTDDSSSQAAMWPVIDRRFAEWAEAGRPSGGIAGSDGLAPISAEELAQMPRYEFTPKYDPNDPLPSIDQIVRDMTESLAAKGYQVAITRVGPTPDMPSHSAPELEKLIPNDLGLSVMSRSAAQWGDAKLRRALKALGVATKVAQIVTGTSFGPTGSTSVFIYGVPGIDGIRLDAEFASVVRYPGFKDMGVKLHAGRPVHYLASPEWTWVWWALDGLVISCGASTPDQLRDLMARFA